MIHPSIILRIETIRIPIHYNDMAVSQASPGTHVHTCAMYWQTYIKISGKSSEYEEIPDVFFHERPGRTTFMVM